MGTEGPTSGSARAVAASAVSFAGEGVDALVDSMTASSTLAILLLLGVIAGAFETFGNSGFGGGLKIFGSPTVSSRSGSLTAFPLAWVACFGASADRSRLPWPRNGRCPFSKPRHRGRFNIPRSVR